MWILKHTCNLSSYYRQFSYTYWQFYIQFINLQMTAHLSKICSRSEDRIGCGFSVTVLTRCTGGKDKLFQDSIRMTLQTGNATSHLVFPIAVSLLQPCCLIVLNERWLQPCFLIVLNEWWLSSFPLAMWALVDTELLYVLFFGPKQQLLGRG